MRHLIGNIVGIAAGTLGASMSLPQAIRAYRKGTQGVSAATFQIFAVGTASWLVYGIFQHLTISVFTNIVLTTCNLAVLYFIRRDGASWRDVTRLIFVFGPIALAIGIVNTGWLAWWGGIVSLLLRIPQAHRLRNADDISGISLTTWVLGAVSNAFWAVYGALLGDHRLLIVCTAVALMSASLSVAVVRKRKSLRQAPTST